jgi:tetratricopeptide (TPR) repeat protein
MSLPSNDPSIASCCSNMGEVYDNMGEYKKALLLHEKALEMREKVFGEDHPDLAISFSNIGKV